MSFKEVKELRKTGKLEDAFNLAKQDLESGPDNIWNKRSFAWVIYDYLKLSVSEINFDNYKEYLVKLSQLELPASENMVFENVAWQIAKMVFQIQKNSPIDFSKINHTFDLIKEFHFTKPSVSFSVLLSAFLKLSKEWPRYIEFADWWEFENLRPEDYLKEQLPNGKTIISIAERAYIAYARKLLEGTNVGFNQREIDQAKIEEFLVKLDLLIKNHPEYQYPPYFKAKLLLAIGGGEDGLSAFIPFARMKRNDFWVWDLLADMFPADQEMKIACYCKALTCKTPEDFLVKTREKLADLLVSKKAYKEAVVETKKIIELRTSKNWRISNKLLEWSNAKWYLVNDNKNSNIDFYKEKAAIAEEILLEDIPEEIAVVEYVNTHKRMLNFIVNKNKFGFFKYDRFLKKVEIADVLKIRFEGESKDDYFKILTVKKTDDIPPYEILKEFSGDIRIRSNQSFGFVDDIFIDPQTISRNKLTDGDKIYGKAILSFNKKKKDWSWKILSISPNLGKTK